MSLTTTLHLNFAGQARAALDHYADVFGGEVAAVPYGESAESPDQAEQLVWGQVSAPGLRLMAYDVQASLPHDPGANPFYVSLRCTEEAEVRRSFDGLADGGRVQVPLGPAAFSPVYGKVTDRFGVTWVIDLEVPWAG